MTPVDPILIAVFGPLGVILGIVAWVGWNVYKLLGKVSVEVNHNGGESFKDMVRDQREYSRDALELLRSMSANQREVKELLREEHGASSEYRLWAASQIEEQQTKLDALDRS
jgi:ClpP class serine protease